MGTEAAQSGISTQMWGLGVSGKSSRSFVLGVEQVTWLEQWDMGNSGGERIPGREQHLQDGAEWVPFGKHSIN